MGMDERAVQRQRAAAQQAKRGVPEEHRADHIDLTSVYTYIITYTCISDIVHKMHTLHIVQVQIPVQFLPVIIL